MTLIAEAERAEDIGEAFSKFKVAVDDQAAEVAALVSELWAVGSALREIDVASQSPDYGVNLDIIEDDLDLVRASLTYTLDDVFRILGKIGNGDRLLTTAAYRQTWKDINYHFQRRAGGRLCNVLETYRLFLLALCNKLRRSSRMSPSWCSCRKANMPAELAQNPSNTAACAAKFVVNLRIIIVIQTTSLQRSAESPWLLRVGIHLSMWHRSC
jgi:hypothetical protein